LKGLIIANGFTNYKADAVTVEVLTSFNMFSLSLWEDYQNNNCFVPWSLFYETKVLPRPNGVCNALVGYANRMVNQQVNDLNARIYVPMW
jgi:hypothetical protein